MINDEQTYDTITAYLNGELSGTALAAFEQQIKENAELAAEVRLHQEMATALSDKKAMKLRKELDSIGDSFLASYEEEKQTTPVRSIGQWRIAAIAASLLLLVVATWLFTTNAAQTDYYAANYAPFPVELDFRDEANLDELEKAQKAYVQKQYTASLKHLNLLDASTDSNLEKKLTINFYRGLNALGLEKPSEALNRFVFVIKNGKGEQKQVALWYSALAHLKLEQLEFCKVKLKQIQGMDKDRWYGKKAGELLRALE